MGIWDWIIGGGKTVETAARTSETIVEGVISGIDKLAYTDEEKADARQKGKETLLKFWETIANENTEQSKARRELAKMSFKVYFSLILMAVGVMGFNMTMAVAILKIVGNLTWLIGMIGGIYFGPHQISKVWKKTGLK